MTQAIINYQDRKLDLTLLRRIAGQGCIITVNSDKVDIVACTDYPELVVVAHGDRFQSLLGTVAEGPQKARLVSKIILKKAYVPAPVEPHAVVRTPDFFGHRPFEQLRDRFNSSDRDGRDRRY
jgi:hypothetical protein